MNDFETVETRKWRALIRIVSVYDNSVVVVIPGWDPGKLVEVSKTEIPDNVLENIIRKMNIGLTVRLHGRVNIGAKTLDSLDANPQSWQFAE